MRKKQQRHVKFWIDSCIGSKRLWLMVLSTLFIAQLLVAKSGQGVTTVANNKIAVTAYICNNSYKMMHPYGQRQPRRRQHTIQHSIIMNPLVWYKNSHLLCCCSSLSFSTSRSYDNCDETDSYDIDGSKTSNSDTPPPPPLLSESTSKKEARSQKKNGNTKNRKRTPKSTRTKATPPSDDDNETTSESNEPTESKLPIDFFHIHFTLLFGDKEQGDYKVKMRLDSKIRIDALQDAVLQQYSSTLKDNDPGSMQVYSGKDKTLHLGSFTTWNAKSYGGDIAHPLIVKVDPIAAAGAAMTGRIADVTFGMDQKYVGSRDLEAFTNRVEALFSWYEKKEMDKFMAPYFPIVQSSGMGKTKIMVEYRKQQVELRRIVLTILCTCSNESIENSDVYDGTLNIQESCTFDSISRQLNILAIEGSNIDTKIVFLFDEAHHLLTQDGFPFRCVRWWLRVDRGETKKYVAVFAGTNSALANFYKDPPPIGSGSSRDTRGKYHNTGTSTMLYPPFFDLCTVACIGKDDSTNIENDYENAVYYGRPLFALIHKENRDLESKTFFIVKRMLLSESDSCWQSYQPALLSILATRVQMGPVPASIVSTLVSKGYANLIDFSNVESHQVAGYCYFTDPVCARLAMCLMDDKWEISDQGDVYKGANPKFWTQKAMEMFANGICTPNKGDVGEIAVALHLLYCGDRLRKKTDSQYRTFGVLYSKWLQLLEEPETKDPLINNEEQKGWLSDSENFDDTERVSFIQFRRIHLRLKLKHMLTQQFLEQLYMSGTGCYLYSYCPIFDLVVSIQKQNPITNKMTYVPLLISIKAHDTFSESNVCDIFQKFDTFTNDEYTNARCMLVLIGGQYTGTKLSTIDDKNKIFIQVPHNDPYGVTDLVLGTTEQAEIAEIYSSHDFAKVFASKNDDNVFLNQCVRTKSSKLTLIYLSKVLADMFQRTKEVN